MSPIDASTLLSRSTSAASGSRTETPEQIKSARDLVIKAELTSTITKTFNDLRAGLTKADRLVNASTVVNPLTKRRYSRADILALHTPEQIQAMAAVKTKAAELLALFAPPTASAPETEEEAPAAPDAQPE